MRENRAKRAFISRLTKWVDRLLPFNFSNDQLPGSKTVLVIFILRELQQESVKMSTYDEQIIVAKLDAIKRSEKRFLLIFQFYGDSAEQKVVFKVDANILNNSDKICSEFAARKQKYSKISYSDNKISKLNSNHCNSTNLDNATHISNSLSAFNRPTNQSYLNTLVFQPIDHSFHTLLRMSNSNNEMLHNIRQTTPKVRFADEAGPPNAAQHTTTPSAPGTQTTYVTNRPSTADFYTDSFKFILSNIFSRTLRGSLISNWNVVRRWRTGTSLVFKTQLIAP